MSHKWALRTGEGKRFLLRQVTRFGRLPFQVSRIGTLGRITVSRDGRWALTLQTERWAKDISMIDNFR